MIFLLLLILYPSQTKTHINHYSERDLPGYQVYPGDTAHATQCVTMQIARKPIRPSLMNVSSLECISFGFDQTTSSEVYWDATKRACASQTESFRRKVTSVLVFKFPLCKKVTESHCMSVTDGTMEEGENLLGPVHFSECQELCRVVDTCTTATWMDNNCTIHKHSKYKKGKGKKVILKDPNCKGRRPTVMRLYRNVQGGDKEDGVSNIHMCLRLQSKRLCSLVDFDSSDQSCWCRKGYVEEKDLHIHNSAVQFAAQEDFQDKGEVTYNSQKSGSLKCGYTLYKCKEKSCQSTCSRLANCIAYSHNSKRQSCIIHFFHCEWKANPGFSLHLVEFNSKLHHDSIKFSCFINTGRRPHLVGMSRVPPVVSKMACAIACSRQKSCLGFTYNKINHICATSLEAKEAYTIRAC